MYVPFRERAREHANNARTILSDQGDDVTASTEDFLAAIAEALTSLAFTQMAPPPRYRPKCQHGVRVVTR